jgi:hypothetical protein
MVTDETFFAWLDGELDPEEANRVAAVVAVDDKLSERAAQHRAMQARLKGAFEGLLNAPLPETLIAAARAENSNVVDLGAARPLHQSRTRAPLPQWAAFAATLAVGIFAGTMVPRGTDAPVEVHGGKVYAAAALNGALDTQLASAPGGEVRIGLTFRDRNGAVCRSFSESAASGLACRNGDRWQIRGLFAAPEGQGGSYRMAGGPDPNLAALVDSTMAGEPLDADQERTAQAKGWR